MAKVRDTFRSHHGRGPDLARVIAEDGNHYVMEFIHEDGAPARKPAFYVPRRHLDEGKTGWTPLAAQPQEGQ